MQPDTPANPAAASAVDDALQARNRQIAAVHTIASLLSSTLDLDERLKDILSVSMEAVDTAAGSILLYRAADEKLVFEYVVGPKARELTGYAMPAGDGVAGRVFVSGQPAVTNQPRQTPGFRADVGQNLGFPSESILTVPLRHRRGSPVGVMQLINKRGGHFEADDLEVAEIIAAVAATAIEVAQLHREAQAAAVAHAVGELSHDIKNKVTPISLSVDTLWPMMDELYADLDQATPAFPPAAAAAVATATDVLRGLYAETFAIIKDQVQEIQDYTKLIADALKGSVTEPSLEPNSIEEVVVEQMRQLEASARDRHVSLVSDCSGVPACRFDRFLVERAVYNLVSNALDETAPGGSVTVSARSEPQGAFPAGRRLVVAVTDTGRGMPPEALQRLLAGDAKSTKIGGTGLGTRIVFNAVAAHKGRFEGESHPGSGTTLRLLLPLAPT